MPSVGESILSDRTRNAEVRVSITVGESRTFTVDARSVVGSGSVASAQWNALGGGLTISNQSLESNVATVLVAAASPAIQCIEAKLTLSDGQVYAQRFNVHVGAEVPQSA